MVKAKKWIQEALGPESKGKLHKKLGIAQGKKIPMTKIKKAEHSKSPSLRKEATLAETLKHVHHKGKKK